MLAFDWSGKPAASFDDIVEFVRARAHRIPELGRRLQEVPGNLEYPRWVRDEGLRQGEFPIVPLPSRTWTDVIDSLGGLLQIPVDTTRAPWRLHVAREVDGVPHVDGIGAVVVFQISHALADGRGASRLARMLFALSPDAIPATHDDAASPGTQLPTALASLVALPFKLARARLGAAFARRAFVRRHDTAPGGGVEPRPGIRGNADPTANRVVHVIPTQPGVVTGAPVSVTTIGLTAVSVATDRLLRELDGSTPATLNALVPMALPQDVQWPAANRIVNGTVDLGVGVENLAQRADAIRKSLSAARRTVMDPLLTEWIRAENLVPAPVFLAVTKARAARTAPQHDTPESVRTNVTVISVDRGDAGLDLCGARPAMTAGFPMLGTGRSVSHGFYGIGDTVTVCVIACPDTFPEHARYAELLEQAVDEVVAAKSVGN